MTFATAQIAEVSALPSARGGVPTVMNTTRAPLSAVARSLENLSRPSRTLRPTSSGSPGSKNGSSSPRRRSTLAVSLSTQVTRLPKSARHAPVTRPTYPVPTTVMAYKEEPFQLIPVNPGRGGGSCVRIRGAWPESAVEVRSFTKVGQPRARCDLSPFGRLPRITETTPNWEAPCQDPYWTDCAASLRWRAAAGRFAACRLGAA